MTRISVIFKLLLNKLGFAYSYIFRLLFKPRVWGLSIAGTNYVFGAFKMV